MAKSRRRLMLAGGACALALVAGGTTAAAWASSSPTPKISETSVTGTVAAPSEASEKGQELTPQAESSALAPLAKVTQQQAEAAAIAAAPGSVTSATLEEEDGFVVWHVNIAKGTVTTEVSIDAGSGAVLHQEAAGSEQGKGQGASDGDGEKADDHAPGAQVSDGDGEQADAAETPNAG